MRLYKVNSFFNGKSHSKNSKHQFAERCFVSIISNTFLLPQYLFIIFNKYTVHINFMGSLVAVCCTQGSFYMVFNPTLFLISFS